MACLIPLSCSEPTSELAVDLLTDLRPTVEFDEAWLEVDGQRMEIDVRAITPASPVRVADLVLPQGTHRIVASLALEGALVVERTVSVSLTGDLAMTVVLSRDCRGVECGEFESCNNRECVDPRCRPETPEFCPRDRCETDDACADVACGTARCILGECLVVDGCNGDEVCGGGDLGCQPDDDCVQEPFGCLQPNTYVETGFLEDGGTRTFSIHPADAFTADSMTLEAWLQFLSPPAEEAAIAGNRLAADGETGARGLRILLVGTNLVYQDGEGEASVPAGPLADGEWHHFALVKNGTTLCSIVDAMERGCAALPARTPAGAARLFVGRSNEGDEPNAHMAVHHLRLWNRPRSIQELERYRWRSQPSDPGLVAEFSMQSFSDGPVIQVLPTYESSLESVLGWWFEPRGNAPARVVEF